MRMRYLGRSGLQISELSFGSWVTFANQMDQSLAERCMQVAYDAGVNFFDNAEVYAAGESERIMGEILRRVRWPRDSFLVSTKIFWGGPGPNQRGLSRKHIIEGTHAALKRLQLDYVDLIFCHRPDQHTPIEETVRAMNRVIEDGQAFYWGTSEWSAQQIMEAHLVAERLGLVAPLMEQPQYHMFHRERVEEEYRFLYERFGLGLTTWSPLAGGLLTGKYNDGIPAESRANVPSMANLRHRFEGLEAQARVAKVRELAPLAADLGCTLGQLAIAWCARNPQVSTVITGASKPDQVAENMKATAVVPKLTDEVLQRIEGVLANRPEAQPDMR